ncbi:hypothetical protein K443DRAFT_347672 [Laccaria amethystina LaAM-08-1]|uniref:Uncharacterized protein n=1 Tax=Laccaria amethystina LaAM-08-1 TaxID=1095629 RepID=A0A0C9WSU2_9AGAR|nr:hypothetical protein K443DRAFT_347672 [Laccaria amethystina LaAM-08-1]
MIFVVRIPPRPRPPHSNLRACKSRGRTHISWTSHDKEVSRFTYISHQFSLPPLQPTIRSSS